MEISVEKATLHSSWILWACRLKCHVEAAKVYHLCYPEQQLRYTRRPFVPWLLLLELLRWWGAASQCSAGQQYPRPIPWKPFCSHRPLDLWWERQSWRSLECLFLVVLLAPCYLLSIDNLFSKWSLGCTFGFFSWKHFFHSLPHSQTEFSKFIFSASLLMINSVFISFLSCHNWA